MKHHLLTLADTTNAERRPMDPDETGVFVRASLAERSPGYKSVTCAELATISADAGSPFPMEVFVKRLALAEGDLRYNASLVVVLIAFAQNVASVVMWAQWLVRETYKKPSGEVVTCTDFADAFPMGVPNDAGAHRIWDAQKGHILGVKGLDNAVDTLAAWTREGFTYGA